LVHDPFEFAFNTVLESYTFVRQVLSADSIAKSHVPAVKLTYVVETDGRQRVRWYFGRFNQLPTDFPRGRMEGVIVAVARCSYRAWLRAGKPERSLGKGG